MAVFEQIEPPIEFGWVGSVACDNQCLFGLSPAFA